MHPQTVPASFSEASRDRIEARFIIITGMGKKFAGFIRKRGPGLVIILAFILLAMVFTRPLLTQGRDHAYKNPYDPTFQAWTLAWDARAITQNPFNLFNANIFFPNPDTLAYSDHQFVTAVMALPLLGITGNPMQTANYMLIFNFFLCEVGAYLLVVHLTRSRTAGVVAGIAFAFAPARLAHMGHLQLSAAAFIPLCLLFLHRYSEEGKPVDAVLCGLFFVLEALSTWYYAMILAFAILVFLVVRLVMKPRAFTLRWTLSLVVVLAFAGAIILPFAMPYLRVQGGQKRFERKMGEVDLFSADVTDFAVAPAENKLWGKTAAGLREGTNKRGGQTERSLFPGLVPLILGAAGAAYLFAKGKGAARFDVRYYVTLIAASFVMCLGSSLFIFGHRLDLPMPYELFYHLFPGFKVMRVPPRFVVLIALSLAVLSGFAVRGILSWLSKRKGKAVLSALATVLILALLLTDLMSAGLPMFEVPPKEEFPAVYTWLKNQPGPTPTVELPLADYNQRTYAAGLQYEETWAPREAWYTYFSTLHWKRIFNGYSGFIPDSYYKGVKATSDFPSQGAVDFFKKEGVEFVIVHGKLLEPARLQSVLGWAADHDDFNLLRRFGTDYLFRIARAARKDG